MSPSNQTGIRKDKIEYFAIKPEYCKDIVTVDYINLLYKLTSENENYLFSEDVSTFETFFKNYFDSKSEYISIDNIMKVCRGSKKLNNKTSDQKNDLWTTEPKEVKDIIGNIFDSFDYSKVNTNIPEEFFNRFKKVKSNVDSLFNTKILNLNQENEEKIFQQLLKEFLTFIIQATKNGYVIHYKSYE